MSLSFRSLAAGPLILSLALACSAKEAKQEAKPVEVKADAAKTPAASAKEVAPDPAGKKPAPAPKPELGPPEPDAEEACAGVVVVSHTGVEEVPEGVSRDSAAALALAKELRAKAEAGEDFVKLAEANSDDTKTRGKRGAIGTFSREAWPERFEKIAAAVWNAPMGGLTPVVEVDGGFAFAKRCAVDKVHTRHILVRYAGAKRADDSVTRTKEEAKARAEEAHAKLVAGGDFAELAKEYGEDGTVENGGDLGPIGRGLFVPLYEDAAWALKVGELAPVVETEFGFHLIRREG